jgi:hypothetical protein
VRAPYPEAEQDGCGDQSLESGALAASAVMSAVSGLSNIESRLKERAHSLWSAGDIIANVRNRCNLSVHQGFSEGRLTAFSATQPSRRERLLLPHSSHCPNAVQMSQEGEWAADFGLALFGS